MLEQILELFKEENSPEMNDFVTKFWNLKKRYIAPIKFSNANDKIAMCITLINLSQDLTEDVIGGKVQESEIPSYVAISTMFLSIVYKVLDNDLMMIFNDVLYKMNNGNHIFYGRFYLPLKIKEYLEHVNYNELESYEKDVMDLYEGRRIDEVKNILNNVEYGMGNIFS